MAVIGNYKVSSDSEIFKIFPKNKKGQTTPITRVNHFLYLEHIPSGTLTVMKRYLHMNNWYWRDSRDTKPTSESTILAEVSRMLFGGDQDRGAELLTQVLTGGVS